MPGKIAKGGPRSSRKVAATTLDYRGRLGGILNPDFQAAAIVANELEGLIVQHVTTAEGLGISRSSIGAPSLEEQQHNEVVPVEFRLLRRAAISCRVCLIEGVVSAWRASARGQDRRDCVQT